jgi:hypothetical protein
MARPRLHHPGLSPHADGYHCAHGNQSAFGNDPG